ncbi:MAG TPA: arylsulfotransferase family protein [Solirubrobacteraceae bacterium]|nr:arylsulfotransferase family protein [Solirubrobacteraceae bacterium]
MNRRRLVGAASAGMAMAVGWSACGGVASTASPGTITPVADIDAAAANPVTVSPLPGTEDASPATQISFLGPPGTQVSDVRIVGSVSGVHSGRIEGYSTGTGASFLPSHPFRTGERVTVHAMVATATGGPGQAADTTFTIAHEAGFSQAPFPNNSGDSRAVQHYSSAPTLTPSTVTVTTPAKPGAAPGDFFLAPYQGAGTPGPMIIDQHGRLVWFHPVPAGDSATNFQVQSYEGKPVLTWWQGKILGVGFGQGEDLLYNSSYEKIAQVRAGNGYHADLHEIRLTPQGTAWIDIFDPVHTNLTAVKGSSEGILTDSVIQEIDIKTGLVMWEWHALGHIAITDSFNPLPGNGRPWDYVHINSVDPGASGDVLLSGRNTWTLYDVDIHTGGYDWRLGGGKHSDFRLGPGVKFYWQHDAEFQPGGLISVFDNGSDPPKERQSRGLLLAPSLSAHTVRLLRQFTNPTHTLLAESQGNMQGLPGGDWLLGYGRLPNFTELDASGHVLFDATLGRNVQNFRTYLSPWSAHPTTTPSLAVRSRSAGLTVLASWNGATEVASWQVLAGASSTSLTVIASAPTQGFQTSIAVTSTPAYLAVQALNASGAVIGRSPTIKP